MTSARGISFEVRPSATLTGVLSFVVCLAGLAPLLTSFPLPLRWLLSAAVVFDGIRRIARFRHAGPRRIGWAADGVWSVTDRRGAVAVAELVGARRVGTAVFLSFRWRRGAGHVALLADNTPADDLRILRARLGHRH
jgi:hypothetical protein